MRRSVLFLAATACAGPQRTDPVGPTLVDSKSQTEVAPPASPRIALPGAFTGFQRKVVDRWGTSPNRRAALVLDKPLYRPGETIWFSALDLDLPTFEAREDRTFARVDLVDPRGGTVQEVFVSQETGRANNAFDLPSEAVGGRWLVRVIRGEDVLVERPVMVQTYEPPRIKKKLDFLRDAHGPGDEVVATVTVARATGEPLANHPLEGRVRIDGKDLDPVSAKTDAAGNASIRFVVPKDTAVGDGMLTVLVEDGGITEGINRRVPIVTGHVDLMLYPEGGDLVVGLPSRVYVEAKDPLGEPADVAGVVKDDKGVEVASFRTVREGLGRLAFTPAAGRSYTLVLTEPADTKVLARLPEPMEKGCVLRAYDDPEGVLPHVRVGIRCTEARTVAVQGVLREHVFDTAGLSVLPGAESVVWLALGTAVGRQGVARITVFEGEVPLAERIVFRNRSMGLQVAVAAKRPRVTPRSAAEVTVTTTDAAGKPVAADVAVAVVDDTVLQYADDEHGNLVAALLLHPELPEAVREPERYLAAGDAEAAVALDLLLGTRGWRRFDWVQTQAPLATDPDLYAVNGAVVFEHEELAKAIRLPFHIGRDKDPPVMLEALGYAMPDAPAPMAPEPEPATGEEVSVEAKPVVVGGKQDEGFRAAGMPAEMGIADDEWMDEGDWGGEAGATLVAARIFPVPAPDPAYEGARTDFRDTIYWNPSVRTDASGQATLSFPVSDAVTEFRVSVDGVGAGLVGHGEGTVTSALPFSLAAKLPSAVTEGDRIEMPLLLANETDRAVNVDFSATFGEGLALVDADPSGRVALAANGRDAKVAMLDVVAGGSVASITLSARGAGLSDAIERQLTLSQRGFPRSFSASGEAKGSSVFTVDTSDARAGTVVGTVSLYPSPLSTLVEGFEGMLREPTGCFEQTSSSNYPNIMVMQYLQSHDAVNPELANRARELLDSGYAKLTSYETKAKGYEWFGSTPPHEALTAYGLVEFIDMKTVYGKVDDAMVRRTADYLLSRRDGKGGYQRDAQALDSFGRASAEVTDAYITWSLARAGMGAQIPDEIARARAISTTTADAYLLALASSTLLPVDKLAGQQAVDRLVALQDANGAFTKADHSITRSGGTNLHAETTALAVLALIADGRHSLPLRNAVLWLGSNRNGSGTWGATQATVLSLQALTAFAEVSRVTRSAGTLIVRIDGTAAATRRYEAGETGTIMLADLGPLLAPGKHTVEVLHDAAESLPFTLGVSWHTEKPTSPPSEIVGFKTEVVAAEVDMGDTVRVVATVTNRTNVGQPMTVARIGLPAGASAQLWQLEELRRTGKVDFVETGTNEVVVYWRALAPNAEHVVNLDLLADVPGRYAGQASAAWLYYDDTFRTWAAPVSVRVRRPN